MKKKISKKQAKEQIEKFFIGIEDKSQKEVLKIKRLAMSFNIPLKEEKKKFCKKCFFPYQGNEKIRIKRKQKSITCNNCGNVSRWQINSS